jgi:hypothetical protein
MGILAILWIHPALYDFIFGSTAASALSASFSLPFSPTLLNPIPYVIIIFFFFLKIKLSSFLLSEAHQTSSPWSGELQEHCVHRTPITAHGTLMR